MERQQGEWWVGSNGNLFCDLNGFRYSIASLKHLVGKASKANYVVARNGVEIAVAPSVADAKLYVKREG